VNARYSLQGGVVGTVILSREREPRFLLGGGEAARLIAVFDWSATALGAIETWPQVVKTTVALILRSPVPIVTLWGASGVMIYNDAYARFAGARHPQILGADVLDAWPEATDWNRKVMDIAFHRGETLSVQDLELTLYRNGVAEPVWMNLDYSPVPAEDGTPAGVIAIVVETTATVRARRHLSGERERLRQMFDEAPGFMALLEGPDHVFAMANGAYHDLVGRTDLIGRSLAEAVPEVVEQGFVDLLDNVNRTREPYVGSATPVGIQYGEGAIEQRFVDFIFQPLVGSDGELAGIFIQGHDVTEHKRSEELRIAHNQILQLAIRNAPLDGILDALVRTVEQWSTSRMLASILLLDRDGVHLRHGAGPSLPDDYNAAIDGISIGPCVGSCGTAAYTREPVFVSDISTDPRWADFKDLAAAHGLAACWSVPILTGAGEVLGTFAMYHREPREPADEDLQLVDLVTRTAALIIDRNRAEEERSHAERRQQLLLGELNHRVKNTLAIVQSLTHQSFHSAVSTADAMRRFEGRLEALAAAHNLLTSTSWESAPIADVVHAALAAFCPPDRCTVEGPRLAVPPQTAVTLALALHELATNAAKYGALSTPEGRIAVRWTVASDQLELTWTERGGPPVTPPEQRGFGTRMIERTLASEFGGKVDIDFAPAGVTCTMVAPLPRSAE
jgi:two-component sensor histidine kinase/PAS domain-containing protein